jgi:GT2 family glycosyltransferase
LGRGSILLQTVRQLLAQEIPPHEIIVVDQTPEPDAETQRALNEWNADGSIRWIRQIEPNASMARNTGALSATGSVLLFLDDDIKIKPEFMTAYMEAFADEMVNGVAGQVLEGSAETLDELPSKAIDPQTGWIHFPRNYSKPCLTEWMASGNFAIRRDLFLRVGGMDANYEKGAYREESDFAMRLMRTGHRFLFQPRASVYHLGAAGAPEGGSRSWIRNKRIAGWHHCVGDWYFTLGNARLETVHELLWCSLRHFVFNRYNVMHPWLLPVLFPRWLSALVPAVWRRVKGPRLVVQ